MITIRALRICTVVLGLSAASAFANSGYVPERSEAGAMSHAMSISKSREEVRNEARQANKDGLLSQRREFDYPAQAGNAETGRSRDQVRKEVLAMTEAERHERDALAP